MSEIKQINTGVAELLAILLPSNGDSTVSKGVLYHWAGKKVIQIKLPPGNWTPLGLSDQLTEGQCRDVVPFEEYFDSDDASLCGDEYEQPILFMEFKHKSIKKNQFKLETAKEAFESLMQANGINEQHLILKRLS